MNKVREYDAITIGASAGGMNLVQDMASKLPKDFSMAVILVQHIANNSDGGWITLLDSTSPLTIKEAEEKEQIERGKIYIAPPNYHLLVENDFTFSLTVDEKVNYARPSIDVFFETASWVFGNRLVGIILSGGNSDGAKGLKSIKDRGGFTIVQDPKSAESPSMPLAAINLVKPHAILNPNEIWEFLLDIHKQIQSDKT
ncbi:MAG TPA: chemotaxis protein CheB [Cyclobacteriaceae bacterium]|jgi:two-component system chemotaxis response regulator CheB